MLLRCLESKLLVRLGHFSYSLYLTHLPVVALCYFALAPARLSESARMFAMIGLGVPASLVVAYGFFWVFERRFVGQPPLFAKE
jgi:peptidoglycan/LPS O-acetylase OafA/YrhL